MKKNVIEMSQEIDTILDTYLMKLSEKEYLDFINSNPDLKLYDTYMKEETYNKITDTLLMNVLRFLKK